MKLIPKILLVNDDVASLMAMESLLTDAASRREFQVLLARSGEEALRQVLTHDFAVILLDVNMPAMDGFETAEAIHSHPRSTKIPIIFITAHYADEMYRLKGYQKGAVDYLLTPVIPQILLSKIAVFVELRRKNLELQAKTEELARLNQDLRVQTMHDLKLVNSQLEAEIIERRQAEERAKELAIRDPLTGLFNRRSLIEHLERARALSARHHKRFALLFLDLDKFKLVNDTLSHEIGDKLLREVALRLSTVIRGSDIAARLGGDEFVILLEALPSVNNVANIANKVAETLANVYHIDEHSINTSASIGIAIFPDDGESAQQLMQNADLAMYHAKQNRPGSIQFFHDELNAGQIEQCLRQKEFQIALSKKDFLLHYQPKMDIRSGQVAAVEVLLRWQHPRLGLSDVRDVIGSTADRNQLLQINDWAISSACAQAKVWLDSGLNLPIIFNPAITHLCPGLVERLVKARQQHQLPPSSLQLTLPESLLFLDQENSRSVVESLRETEIFLGIDDFGAGYASITALKEFSPAFLKIHASFVKDWESQSDIKMLAGIINLCHAMSLRVTIGGVENERQLAILRKLGCDEFQGAFFRPPVAANDLPIKIEEINCTLIK